MKYQHIIHHQNSMGLLLTSSIAWSRFTLHSNALFLIFTNLNLRWAETKLLRRFHFILFVGYSLDANRFFYFHDNSFILQIQFNLIQLHQQYCILSFIMNTHSEVLFYFSAILCSTMEFICDSFSFHYLIAHNFACSLLYELCGWIL